jgi:hypothetical protein
MAAPSTRKGAFVTALSTLSVLAMGTDETTLHPRVCRAVTANGGEHAAGQGAEERSSVHSDLCLTAPF